MRCMPMSNTRHRRQLDCFLLNGPVIIRGNTSQVYEVTRILCGSRLQVHSSMSATRRFSGTYEQLRKPLRVVGESTSRLERCSPRPAFHNFQISCDTG